MCLSSLDLPVHFYADLSVVFAFWIVLPIGLLDLYGSLGKLAAMPRNANMMKVGKAYVISPHGINVFIIYCII